MSNDSSGPVAPVRGRLTIRAEQIGSKTILTDVGRTEPFHVGVPIDRVGDGRAEVIVQSVGAGLLPGDETTIEISVGPGAFLIVKDQGAVKLFSSRSGDQAVSDVRLHATKDATLIYLPGELIPYRNARFRQTTEIEVEPGGRVAFAEMITPGRTGMGETNVYDRLDLRVRARIDSKLVLLDRSVLEPTASPLTSAGRHGDYPVSGVLYLIGSNLPEIPPIEDSGPVLSAVGSGPGYQVMRMLGPTAQAVKPVVERAIVSVELRAEMVAR